MSPRRKKKAVPRKWQRPDFIPSARRDWEDREDALTVVSLARRLKLPLLRAVTTASERGTPISSSKVLEWTGSAWRKHGKDYRAKSSDRIYRLVKVEGRKGKQTVLVKSSRASSKISRHHLAIKKALEGKPSALRAFRRQRIPYSKDHFETRSVELKRRDEAGLLDYKSIYSHKRKR